MPTQTSIARQPECPLPQGFVWPTAAVLTPCGYTRGMKTAVSIPNSLFEGAERLAKRTRKSRSQLYSDAVREYLARHAPDAVTEAMDRACTEAGVGSDPFISAASSRILERSEW